MGTPAIVSGDRITGMCAVHQIPNPTSGAPQPSPSPLPFSAPVTQGLATKVQISGRFAAVMGTFGQNATPHVGLHGLDPFLAPAMQVGLVQSGSSSVFIEGKPAATATSQARCCVEPGSLVPSVTTVLIG